jgi:hypothetical protein
MVVFFLLCLLLQLFSDSWPLEKKHGFLDATHRAEIEVRFFLFLGGLI